MAGGEALPASLLHHDATFLRPGKSIATSRLPSRKVFTFRRRSKRAARRDEIIFRAAAAADFIDVTILLKDCRDISDAAHDALED